MPYPVSPDPIREQELSSSQDQKKMTGPLSKEALRMHDDDRYEFQWREAENECVQNFT